MNKNIKEEIFKRMQENINKKMEIVKQQAQEQADEDKEKVEKAVEMISKRLVYKQIGKYYYDYKYILATEEMFYEDYLKESKWDKGIKFYESEKDNFYRGIFSVNGENYYDMRFLLNKYAEDVKKSVSTLEYQRDKLYEIKHQYESLVSKWPEIKKLISDWNNLQKEMEDEDEE